MEENRYFQSQDVFVWIVAVLFLLVGGILTGSALNARGELHGDGYRISYPAVWMVGQNKEVGYQYAWDHTMTSPFQSVLRVKRLDMSLPGRRTTGKEAQPKDKAEEKDKDRPERDVDPLTLYMMDMANELPLYRELSSRPISQSGLQGSEFQFAYVFEPDANPTQPDIPVVVRGVGRTLVNKARQEVFVITYACDERYFREKLPEARSILGSFMLHGTGNKQ